MLNRVYNTVDSLPLVGKYTIAPTLKSYIESDGSHEKLHYAGTQALLAVMVGGHAMQAVMGYESMSSHVEHLLGSEADPLTYAATTVDTLYMCVNGLVTARQANLMYRVEDIRKKKSIKSSRQEAAPSEAGKERNRSSEPYLSGKGKAFMLALGVTLAGQIAFGQSYAHAEHQADERACYAETSQYYDAFVESSGHTDFIPKEMYIEEVCE